MKTKEQIEEALILATSNPYNAEDILDDSDAIMEIVNEFAEEWEDADCDDEDATPEQKAELDALLAKYTDRIHDVINKPHSIEYSYYDQRLRWYDANGLQMIKNNMKEYGISFDAIQFSNNNIYIVYTSKGTEHSTFKHMLEVV